VSGEVTGRTIKGVCAVRAESPACTSGSAPAAGVELGASHVSPGLAFPKPCKAVMVTVTTFWGALVTHRTACTVEASGPVRDLPGGGWWAPPRRGRAGGAGAPPAVGRARVRAKAAQRGAQNLPKKKKVRNGAAILMASFSDQGGAVPSCLGACLSHKRTLAEFARLTAGRVMC